MYLVYLAMGYMRCLELCSWLRLVGGLSVSELSVLCGVLQTSVNYMYLHVST